MMAEQAYKSLRGLFCIYKPPDKSMQAIVRGIQFKLSEELNLLPCRPPRKIIQFNEGDSSSESLPVITTVPDLADHTLVVGARYNPEDFVVSFCDGLATYASGVTVMSLGVPGWLRNVLLARFVRVYRLKGELGRSTDKFTDDGRTVERTTYGHVTAAKMDRVITAMQAGHQKHMFTSSGLDLQSQEAYDLAVGGLLRPKARDGGPVIYGFRCVEFEPPHFTLEVQTINETAQHLAAMVHKLGLELRSGATVNQIQRLRYGPLHLDHALLQKHWTVENIVENMETCKMLLEGEKVAHRPQIERARPEEVNQLPLPER